MKSTVSIIVLLFILVGCNNLEDATPSTRTTFIKFYEGAYDFEASSIEIIPTGYVILGNMTVELEDTTYLETLLIELDENGNRIGDFHTYGGGTGKAFKPIINNNLVEGYVIVGDSIYIDPSAEQAANVAIASLRVLSISSDFADLPLDQENLSDTVTISPLHPVKADFFGGAVNFTDDGRVIILATFKEGVPQQLASPEKQLLIVVNIASNGTITRDWVQSYDLLDDTYQNTKSIHYANGSIIWATAIADVQGEFNSSYICIPVIAEESIPDNFNVMGETSTQLFVPKDIQPARSAAFGYGIVGTYSELTDGSKGNMFFIRIDPNGNIVSGSDRYFDGIDSFLPIPVDIDKNTSSIIDEGESITSTKDGGFVLAGSMTTNPLKGNGGKDILLIKLNGLGNTVWAKTMGGSGDETVSTIRETAEGDLLICGTNRLGDYSSIFLIKTDMNGELKK